MEKIHAMTFRKLIAGALLSLITTLFLSMAPMASAIEFDFDSAITDRDAAQGDVTQDECASLDDSLAAALGCDTQDRIIDFTNFDGSLEGPDASGYDEALTQSDNARDLIQTLVNFALSFLGLVATIIIIYGGVMYVTSRGDEEQASKGKKAISYAVIGILIILSSFAIVNTLIGSTGGGNTPGGGSATTNISEAGQQFDVRSVLNELESISADYLEAYDTFLLAGREIEAMRSMEMPLVVDVIEQDKSVGGIIEHIGELITGQDDDFKDQYALIDENDVDEYVDDLRKGIQRLQRNIDSLSDTYEESQFLFNYLRSGTQASNFQLIPSAHAVGYATTNSCANRVYDTPQELRGTYLSEGFGFKTYKGSSFGELDGYICTLLDNMLDANARDYVETVEEISDRMSELTELFEPTGGTPSGTLAQVRSDFTNVVQLLNRSEDLSQVNNSLTRDIVRAIGTAYTSVQNVQFVNAVMSASAVRGNAPLIVRFDVLGSSDPSGVSISDETDPTRIKWDLDGDGQYDDGNGVSINFAYDKPGTYQVRARIDSSDTGIASGIARATIIVDPRSSVIILKATAGGEPTTVADFSTFPAIDHDNYKVTLNEATSSIVFDASESTDGEGSPLIFYEWDFGDGETTEGATEETVTHLYGEQGRYQLILTVTDSTGVTDKKYLNLFVASPAARIDVTPEVGQIGTTFRFSGAGSTTDLGTIVSYQWSALKDGENYDLAEATGSSIDATFDQPGVYVVSLTVADSGGSQDTATRDVLVESQTPQARFTYSIPNSTEPGTYLFDGSDSNDPDPSDILTYEWDFGGIEGEDYEVLDFFANSDKATVKFLTAGPRDVSLKVQDQHVEELQKSATAATEVNVSSVLDVQLEVIQGTTRRLDDDGEAIVNFKGRSATASAMEIEFGDGESEFTDTLTGGEANFSHTYDDAGIYYVTLHALDEGSGRNSQTRRVYVAGGDSPIAVINVTADGEDIGFGDTLKGNTQTKFSFDASESVNLDGTPDNLSYSWNFGDGTTSSQRTVTHTYDENVTYPVVLTVKDKDDPKLTDENEIEIQIQGIDPEIKGITVTPVGATLETPLKVNVGIDASDRDGRINFVKAWYYDINESAKPLGTVISESTNFSLTINTKGEEAEEITYGFAAEVTDDDNRTVNSFDELTAEQIPTLTVTNGPNDSPVANFSVDRTSLLIGEEVRFSSTSFDPDGEIVEYTWDLEGDGFFNNEPSTETTLEHVFNTVYPDGVKVRLRVVDDSGASALSDELTLFVDANAQAPDAAFLADVNALTVQFRDNSEFDTENGSEFDSVVWDFDTSNDSDGNGTPDDDEDSTDPEPSFTYDDFGSYSVKMTITDNLGQTDTVTRDVFVVESDDPIAAFKATVSDKKVTFTNNSSTDTENGAGVREYIWDFDLNVDSDGDGKKENDSDSTRKSPSFTYKNYGLYKVKLTIIDDFGKSDLVVLDVNVVSPADSLEALLSSVPQANKNKQIIMLGNNGDVTFFFSAKGGSGDFSYKIDKNIFFDTGNDGVRDNDIDFAASKSGSWKTNFDKSYGQIVVKLTVTDNKTGATDIETLQVVFQGSLGGANLFNATPSEMLFLILSALLAAIAGISLFIRHNPSFNK